MECSHENCTCRVDDGFCSPACENAQAAGPCPCGHPECAATDPELPVT